MGRSVADQAIAERPFVLFRVLDSVADGAVRPAAEPITLLVIATSTLLVSAT
jgi:hypothetical protein